MGALFLIIVFGAMFIIVAICLPVHILHRAGYSGWWVILQLVPLVNLIMIWVFAFSTWPKTQPTSDVAKVLE
jgi:uncharacterized membrane protein YhaH (DUF805 family)